MMNAVLSILFITVLFYKNVFGYMRVCYYTNWSQYRPNGAKFTADNIDPTLCTHIVYAFGKLEGNRLIPYEWNDDSADRWSLGMYAKVNNFKKSNPQLRTLLAIGGWNAGSAPFSSMASTEPSRREFINSTLHFLRAKNFDGLDLDWEYPARRGGRPDDKLNLVHLLTELNRAFEQESYHTGQPRLLLSAAVPAGKSNIDAGFDIPNVARNLDFINIMTYDLHGSWDSTTGHNSPLFGRATEDPADSTLNMDWAVKYWLQNGAPKHKLIVGLGLYGRSFKLKSPASNGMGALSAGAGKAGLYTKEPGFLAYYEVCEELKKGATRVWQSEHKVPYAHNGDLWVGYDDEESIREKVRWMKQNKLGGIMVWSLALDDFKGDFCNRGPYPLLTTINEELGTKKPRVINVPSPPFDLVPPGVNPVTISQGMPPVIPPPKLPTIPTPPSPPLLLPGGNPVSGIDPQTALSLPLPNIDLGQLNFPFNAPNLPSMPSLSNGITAPPMSKPATGPATVPTQPPPVFIGNTGAAGHNANTSPVDMPIIVSDPGNRALVSPQTVPPLAVGQSQSNVPSIDNNILLAMAALSNANNNPPQGNADPALGIMSMRLAHDHPPAMMPLQPTMPVGMPSLVHHAQPVPGPPVIMSSDTQGLDAMGPVLVGGAPQAAAIHAGILPEPVLAAPALLPVPVERSVEVSIERPSVDASINVGDNSIVGAVIPGPPIATQIETGGTVAGIPLSAVRPGPRSNPGVNLSFSSSSNSSSSSSSSKSESQSSSIQFGGGHSIDGNNPSVAHTLRDLLHHHAPLSSSSSSSSASSSSSSAADHQAGHGTSHIPISVIKNPNDLSIPPGSRVEAVIPINSIDNLAEVLASLGTSVPSSNTAVVVADENAVNTGQLMRELDLSNLLGIDPRTIGGAAPAITTVSEPTIPVARNIPRSRQVFSSPVIEQVPLARRTPSSSRQLSREQLLRRRQQLQAQRQLPRSGISRTRTTDRRQQQLAILRARRLAQLRAARQRQAAAARSRQRGPVNLNQISDVQLRRLLNRLDGGTLQRLIREGRITLTPNVERPRAPTTRTSTRSLTPGSRSTQRTSGTLFGRRRLPMTSLRGNRFGTGGRQQGTISGGRRVVFLDNNPAFGRRSSFRSTRDPTRRFLSRSTI